METHILWLEDDMPEGRKAFPEDVVVHVARNCLSAQQILDDRSKRIDGVIVDIRVPQSKWEKSCRYPYPGLAFLEKEVLSRNIPTIVMTGAILKEHAEELKRVGVQARHKVGLVLRDELIGFAKEFRFRAAHDDVDG